jgi:uncharacterized membrane protein
VTPLVIVRVVATVCTGLAAGIFLGHRRGVSLAAPSLPPSSFLQLQQVIHVHFACMMPFLMLSAAGGSLIWAILLRDKWRTPELWLVAAAAVGMLSAVLMTRAVNIPINIRLMTWKIEAPPADLMEQWGPWERVHSVRTILATTALVLQVVALSAFAS